MPVDGRLYLAEQALAAGATVEQVAAASGFDPWFVDQIALVHEVGDEVRDAPSLTPELLRRAKRLRPVRPADRRAAAGAGR